MGALDRKVALVAGGGSGIGRATAELFAAEGARVVVFGRRREPLEDTVDAIVKAGGTATAVAGDVASEADAARLVETAQREYSGVDVLVNSAAVRLRAPLTEISAADFAEVLRINLVGAFVLTKAVVPAMRRRGGGNVVLRGPSDRHKAQNVGRHGNHITALVTEQFSEQTQRIGQFGALHDRYAVLRHQNAARRHHPLAIGIEASRK